jgi:hypothetical protein
MAALFLNSNFQQGPTEARMKTSWRITPPTHMAAEVRRIALSEGRTDSATLLRLVSEALQARQRADSSVERLTKLLTAVVTEQSPS